MREAGYEPSAVRSLAVLTGSAESVRAVPGLDELAQLIDLSEISRAPARFDEADLDGLNARLVHEMPFAAAANRLREMGVPDERADAFWLAVRANLGKVSEAAEWWRVVEGPVTPKLDDPALIEAAQETLPAGPFDETTWKTWTGEIRARTGAKGRALFMPLRLALTGLDHGPDLAGLLPLARLAGETC